MGTLADNIRQASLKQVQEKVGPQASSADLQTQLAVGATGKGQSTGQNLKQSNVAEQINLVKARAAEQQVVQQGMDQAAEVANQEAKQELEVKQLESANRLKEEQISLEKSEAVSSMLAEIKYSDTQLEMRQDQADVENAARAVRLSNRKYRHQLDMAGKQGRLAEKVRLDKELKRLVIGERTANLYKDIENRMGLRETELAAAWQDKRMSLDMAMDIAVANIEDETQKQAFAAGRDVAVAGWDVYGEDITAGVKGYFNDSGAVTGAGTTSTAPQTDYMPKVTE